MFTGCDTERASDASCTFLGDRTWCDRAGKGRAAIGCMLAYVVCSARLSKIFTA